MLQKAQVPSILMPKMISILNTKLIARILVPSAADEKNKKVANEEEKAEGKRLSSILRAF